MRAADEKKNKTNKQKSITYGELTKAQQLARTIPADPAVTPAKDWRIAGTSVAKVNGRAFATGSHRYTSDLTRPAMLYGKVLRPSALHAPLISLDASAAENIPSTNLVH